MRLKLVLVGFLLAAFAENAYAGEPAASSIYDVWAKPDANERMVALEAAQAQERARANGYGPGVSNTYIAGDYNQNQTYNGPVVSATTINSGQTNTTSVSTSGSSNVVVSVANSQTADTITQTGTSGADIGTSTSTTTNGCTGLKCD